MNKRLNRLIARREHLVLQVAAQRIVLAQDMEPLRVPLALADRGVAALRYIKHHPALSVSTTLIVAVLRPTRVGRWMMSGWAVWQLGRSLFRR